MLRSNWSSGEHLATPVVCPARSFVPFAGAAIYRALGLPPLVASSLAMAEMNREIRWSLHVPRRKRRISELSAAEYKQRLRDWTTKRIHRFGESA